jgi:hypothetical protein
MSLKNRIILSVLVELLTVAVMATVADDDFLVGVVLMG